MRYLNTLYVQNHRARVKCRRGSLLVTTPAGDQRVPLKAVDALVMLGSGQITSQALEACVKQGVCVAALRRGGSVRFVVGPQTGGNVHLRMALYRAVEDPRHSLALSKAIVAAKLQNSRKVMGRWSRDERDPEAADDLASRAAQIWARVPRLGEASSPDRVRGIEGDGARIYFRGLRQVVSRSELRFSSRSKRPPRDPVNAALSFSYGLVVTEYIGATESVGLDYQMGFFHRPRSGRPSLALDLAEELRPLTDRFIVSLIRRRQLQTADFAEMPGGAVYFNENGRIRFLKAWEQHKAMEIHHPVLRRRVGRWALPSLQATLLARHLRGDLPAYPPFLIT